MQFHYCFGYTNYASLLNLFGLIVGTKCQKNAIEYRKCNEIIKFWTIQEFSSDRFKPFQNYLKLNFFSNFEATIVMLLLFID